MGLWIKQFRQSVYWFLGCATICIYVAIEIAGGIDRAGFPLLAAMGVMAGLWGLTILCDVVYHSWKGEGQACPHCGTLRQMASFRIYAVCSQCQK